MSRFRVLALPAIAVVTLWAAGGVAQASSAEEILKIWPGQAPGTTDWTGAETTNGMALPGGGHITMVTNVTIPTLTVFRPPSGKANGTGIIVAPGGGFMALAVEHEGTTTAEWLAARGVTAFVLKYRVKPWALKLPADARHHPEQLDDAMKAAEPRRQIAFADGVQAMHYLRANAARIGIRTDRIGFMGFSAGAYTTMRVVMQSPTADRPDFAAPIYGAMDDTVVPKDAPPLFIAAAQDDPTVPATKSLAIFSAWTAADRPAELHIYEKGRHGFGANKAGKPVDGWLDAFGAWLSEHGWMAKGF